MENESRPSVPPVQPIPQNLTSVPTQLPTNWLKILLFTALGLVVITGSVFAGIQIGKNQAVIQQPITVPPTASPTQTAQPTTTPTDNPTTDWKIYTDNNFGYSFKYPSDWGIGSKCEGDAKDNLVRIGPNLLKFPHSDCGTANIPSTVMIYINTQPPRFDPNYSVVDQREISIEKNKIIFQELSIKDRTKAGSDSILFAYVLINEKYLIFQTGAYPLPDLKSKFIQIISTLKRV